ncbi:MAG TPA: hypothetical protein VGM97_07125, partial [Steroidobacteraceae bacterium]
MRDACKTAWIVSVATVAFGAGGLSQADPKIGTTINDPPGPLPDPTHVPVVLPKDIKCVGPVGAQQTCT